MRSQGVLWGVCLLFAVPALAQQAASDSLYLYRQARRSIEYAHTSATALLADSTEQAAALGLYFEGSSGDFRRAQEAQRSHSAALRTNGISTLGRFKVAGSFSLSRVWEDSLAWDQRGIAGELRPYYFASEKAGEFERQTYRLRGIATYALLENKLFLSSGAALFYHESTRSVDPRPRSAMFSLEIAPGISYRAGKHLFGLTTRVGYGDEDTRISFKSSTYLNSPPPDRVNYFILGYGSFINYHLSSATQYRKDRDYVEFRLDYASDWDGWAIRSDFSYRTEKETTAIPLERSVRDSTFGIFYTDQYSFSLLTTRSSARAGHQWYFSAFHDQGRDFYVAYQASNYRYDRYALLLDYLYLDKKQKRQSLEWGGSVRYEDLKRQDITSSHHIREQVLEARLSGTWYLKSRNGDRLSAGLSPGIWLPLNNELTVPPTQENLFTRGVIYPDYAYRASRVGQVNLDAGYITPRLSGNFATGISARVAYRRRLDSPDRPIPIGLPGQHPGNSRWTFNVSVNMYL